VSSLNIDLTGSGSAFEPLTINLQHSNYCDEFTDSSYYDCDEFTDSIHYDCDEFTNSIHYDCDEFTDSIHYDCDEFTDSSYYDCDEFTDSSYYHCVVLVLPVDVGREHNSSNYRETD